MDEHSVRRSIQQLVAAAALVVLAQMPAWEATASNWVRLQYRNLESDAPSCLKLGLQSASFRGENECGTAVVIESYRNRGSGEEDVGAGDAGADSSADVGLDDRRKLSPGQSFLMMGGTQRADFPVRPNSLEPGEQFTITYYWSMEESGDEPARSGTIELTGYRTRPPGDSGCGADP